MSTMILTGFCHGGEDSLLLKNFLAGGDSARRGEGTRGVAPSSLLPAHISAAIDTDEWLADKSRAATARAAVGPGGRPNIMAPVLKSTSAEYWLDREGRPPVNERGG